MCSWVLLILTSTDDVNELCVDDITHSRVIARPLGYYIKVHVPNFFLGGCQGRRTGVGLTTVSNSLILGVKSRGGGGGVEGWVTIIF